MKVSASRLISYLDFLTLDGSYHGVIYPILRNHSPPMYSHTAYLDLPFDALVYEHVYLLTSSVTSTFHNQNMNVIVACVFCKSFHHVYGHVLSDILETVWIFVPIFLSLILNCVCTNHKNSVLCLILNYIYMN